jgi:hypothetical protein
VTLYWLMYLLPVGMPGLLRSMKIDSHKLGVWLIIGFLFALFIGFRDRVGCDWGSYLNYYKARENISFFDALVKTDPAYGALNWFGGKIGIEIYGVNLICGLVCMAGLIKFNRRQPLPWLALAVSVPYLIIVLFMGYARQGLALGFILLGLSELRTGSSGKYIFFIILAGMSHKTAAILLPLALVYSTLSIKVRIIILVPLVSIAGYFLMADSYDTMVVNYVDSDMQSAGGLIRIWMNAIPALVILLFIKKFRNKWEDMRIWIIFSIISLISIPMVALMSTVTDRLALYLIPLQIVFYSRFPMIFPAGLLRNSIIFSILSGYAVVMYVWLVHSVHAPKCWVPYNNIIFN